MTQYSDELYHHGIKGMHWGVRRTPEQLGHRLSKQKKKLSKTYEKAKAASSSRNYKKMEKLSKSATRTAKAIGKTQRKIDEAKEIEAQLKAEQARQLEVKKNNLLKSGTAAEIFANRELFSTNELNEAINRATALTTLKDLKNQDTVAKMNKAKQFIDGAANVGKSIKGAADAYNDLAKVINSLAGEKKLPTFDVGKKDSSDAIEKLLRTGDANKIAEALPYMTDEQVGKASKRLSNERAIKNYADKASKSTSESSTSSESSSTSTPKEEETPKRTNSTETKSNSYKEISASPNVSIMVPKTEVSRISDEPDSYVSQPYRYRNEEKFFSTGKEYVQSGYVNNYKNITIPTSTKSTDGTYSTYVGNGEYWMENNSKIWDQVKVSYTTSK